PAAATKEIAFAYAIQHQQHPNTGDNRKTEGNRGPELPRQKREPNARLQPTNDGSHNQKTDRWRQGVQMARQHHSGGTPSSSAHTDAHDQAQPACQEVEKWHPSKQCQPFKQRNVADASFDQESRKQLFHRGRGYLVEDSRNSVERLARKN